MLTPVIKCGKCGDIRQKEIVFDIPKDIEMHNLQQLLGMFGAYVPMTCRCLKCGQMITITKCNCFLAAIFMVEFEQYGRKQVEIVKAEVQKEAEALEKKPVPTAPAVPGTAIKPPTSGTVGAQNPTGATSGNNR
jgi:uncharacterized Zn finger protein